jgi:hypothetical protein
MPTLLIDTDRRRIHEMRETAALLEAELSHDETRQALYNALRQNRTALDGSYCYRYIQAVYDTFVVYEESAGEGTRLYKVTYAIDGQGQALLGTPVEVRAEVNYIPIETTASEAGVEIEAQGQVVAGDCSRLAESAVGENGKIRIKLIGPGAGSSCYYPADVLKRDCAKAFPAGTKMFWNHPARSEEADRPERDLDDVAAVLLTDATWDDNGPLGPGPYADAEVKSWYRTKVSELAKDIGVSIYARGRIEPGEVEGKTQLVLQELFESRFNTVDFVTYPGAEGEIVQLFEAARPKSARLANAVNPSPQTPQIISESTSESTQVPQEENTLTEQEAQALKDENARLRAERSAREAATATLADIDMPEAARTRVIEAQAAQPVLNAEGTLDVEAFKTQVIEAAKTEVTYAQSLGWGGGEVNMSANGKATKTPETKEGAAPAGVAAVRANMGLS